MSHRHGRFIHSFRVGGAHSIHTAPRVTSQEALWALSAPSRPLCTPPKLALLLPSLPHVGHKEPPQESTATLPLVLQGHRSLLILI